MSAPVTHPKGLSPKTEYFIERHGSVLLVWLLLLFMGWLRNGAKLLRGELTNNDDYMRMVEVRDWLGGQNWFDLHQYRLNPTDPLLSHWSRISDVLIGGPIKFLTPFLGQARAELAVVIAYPSLLLLAYLYLATALAKQLSTNRDMPVITTFMLALSFGVLSQFGMGRIDHHGLQIVLGLATCLLIITSTNKPKRLIFAGILCGLALYIGIESAPYVAAACIAVVLIWVFSEQNAAQKLRYFGLALAASTLVCLLISAPPSRWFTPSCDAISVVYTQLTLAVAVILWALSYLSKRVTSAFPRFALAGILGSLALVFTLALYPQCLKGPYANLDPRLVEIWLSNVAEAGNFISFAKGDIVAAVAAIILPIIAIIGYFLFSKKNDTPLNKDSNTPHRAAFALTPRSMVLFIVLAFIAGLLQTRVMFFATAFAVPLAAYCLVRALEWAGKFKPKAAVIALRAILLVALAPVTLPLILGQLNKPDTSPKIAETAPACTSADVLKSLRALPSGTALTQIDLGAPILKFTDLSVTSAPYHRSASGILAALDMFIADKEIAKQTVVAMQADYVIACRHSPETGLMTKYGPDGVLARMLIGESPSWLQKIELKTDNTTSHSLDESLLIYQVNLP